MTTTAKEELAARAATDPALAAIVSGYDAGRTAAQAIKPGDYFFGAMPAAIAAGFQCDTIGYRGFLVGYLSDLPDVVTTDHEGRVVRLGR